MSDEEPKHRDRTAVYVAIVGLVGTLGAALIGFASTRSQLDIPITATRTAEARQMLQVSPSVSSTMVGATPSSATMSMQTPATFVMPTLSPTTSTSPTKLATLSPTADSRSSSSETPDLQPTVPGYFRPFDGELVYMNGLVQTFSGLSCFYSGRLYYSHLIESFNDGYTSAPTIDLEQILRIDFSERPNAALRLGTAKFRNGTVLENVYFYVEECSWWEEPGLQGKLNDPVISALIIHTVTDE